VSKVKGIPVQLPCFQKKLPIDYKERSFLAEFPSLWWCRRLADVLRRVKRVVGDGRNVVDVVGEDAMGLGTNFAPDGA